MSTKAGTMGFSGRPAVFTFWTVAVSALAAAALILSAVALNVAVARSLRDECGGQRYPRGRASKPRRGTRPSSRPCGAACSPSPSRPGHVPLWDAGKLDAMKGRVLAETVRIQGYAPLWDAGKLEAMEGRVLAG